MPRIMVCTYPYRELEAVVSGYFGGGLCAGTGVGQLQGAKKSDPSECGFKVCILPRGCNVVPCGYGRNQDVFKMALDTKQPRTELRNSCFLVS